MSTDRDRVALDVPTGEYEVRPDSVPECSVVSHHGGSCLAILYTDPPQRVRITFKPGGEVVSVEPTDEPNPIESVPFYLYV